MVLAASFLAFIDLFRLGRVYTSRCFGYTIFDLFSLVKLPVVFDLVRTTVLGVCRYLFFLCFLLCSLREQGTHNLVYKFVLVDSLRVCGGLVGNGEKVCIKDGEDCGVKNHKSRKVKWPSSGSVGCVCRLDRASVRAEDLLHPRVYEPRQVSGSKGPTYPCFNHTIGSLRRMGRRGILPFGLAKTLHCGPGCRRVQRGKTTLGRRRAPSRVRIEGGGYPKDARQALFG